MLIAPFFRRTAISALLFFAAAASAQPGQGAVADVHDPVADSLVAMRALDGRVATIGHRLAVATLDLCTERQWLPGIALHDLSQYGPDHRSVAARAFGLEAGPGVLALASGGPAERAGLRLDDVLVRVDGAALPRGAVAPAGSFDHMEHLLDALERAFADGVATVEVKRAGETLRLDLLAERGCASRFQLIPSRKLNAHADGQYVQITTAMAAYVADEDELAWVLAHEFAHNVLRHRVRLDAAGVERGFLGNFGRNARLIREVEGEADALSVYLLERAGYDPQASVRFWARFGRRGFNFLGSPTHPNWRRRIASFETEIARIRQSRAAGAVPVPAFLTEPAAPTR